MVLCQVSLCKISIWFVIMQNVNMPCIIMQNVNMPCVIGQIVNSRHAKCHHGKRQYVKQKAMCHCAKRHYDKCHYAKWQTAKGKSHYAKWRHFLDAVLTDEQKVIRFRKLLSKKKRIEAREAQSALNASAVNTPSGATNLPGPSGPPAAAANPIPST
jgi:hypothetical protein